MPVIRLFVWRMQAARGMRTGATGAVHGLRRPLRQSTPARQGGHAHYLTQDSVSRSRRNGHAWAQDISLRR